jgi:peptidoglycan hydrolase CwlO-like protein
MTSGFAILLGIYAAGAIVGLLCWLPFYLSNKKWIGQLKDAHREQFQETSTVHSRWVETAGDLERNRAQLAATSSSLSQTEKERDSLRSRSFELANKVRSLEESVQRLRRELAETGELLRQSEGHAAKLRGEIETRDAEFAAQRAEWNAQRVTLETQITDARGEISRLRDDMAKLDADANRRQVEADAERTRLERELAETQASLAGVKRELDQLKSEIAAQTNEWRTVRGGLETELNAAKSEAFSLTAQIEQLKNRERLLTSERDDTLRHLREAEDRAAVNEQKHAAARSDCERSDSEVRRLIDANTQLEARAAALTQEITEARAEAEEAIRTAEAALAPKTPPQRSALAESNSSRLIVGLDFGTHSTKVVFRGEGSPDAAWVVQFDDPTTSYPSFAAPTLVRMDDGKMFFGSRAVSVRQGQLFGSMKRDLAAAGVPRGERRIEANLAAELAAIYLAWVMRQVRSTLNVRPEQIVLQVGLPAVKSQDDAFVERFRRVVQAAWELSLRDDGTAIQQGMLFENVASQVRELLDHPAPPLGQGVGVFPEAICPVVSLARSGALEGSVFVIDMGGESTELSVHELDGGEASRRVVRCTREQSLPVGGELFSDNDASARSVDGHRQTEEQLLRTIRDGVSDMMRHGLAFKNGGSDSGRPKPLVIKVGGGLRRRCVGAAVDEVMQLPDLRRGVSDGGGLRAVWHIPAGLASWDGELPLPADEMPILAAAHGLSTARHEWPKVEGFVAFSRFESPPVSERVPALADV